MKAEAEGRRQSAFLLSSQQPAAASGPLPPVTPRTALRLQHASSKQTHTTFDPVPRYILLPPAVAATSPTTMEAFEQPDATLTDAELLQVKELNQRRIKRIIAAVGIALTIISILLVGLSLSLGQKIDELVGKSLNDGRLRAGDASYFGAKNGGGSGATNETR